MLDTSFDFSDFIDINMTQDAAFVVGKNGVDKILTPKDKKSDFIFFGSSIFVRIKTNLSGYVLYPLNQPQFKPKVEAVLMDLDGTSVKSEGFWICIIRETMRQLTKNQKLDFTAEDIPFVSGFTVSEHLQYCINKYSPGSNINEARELYYKITDYEMNEILCGRGRKNAFEPADGLKEFLITLKKEHVKIGLVTSGLYKKALPEIMSAFKTLDLGNPIDFYDAIITAGTTYVKGKQTGTLGEMCAKPHPWLYSEVAHIGLGIDEHSSSVIGIEDSSAGAISIALAGYPVIGVTGGNIKASGLNGLLSLECSKLPDILNYVI